MLKPYRLCLLICAIVLASYQSVYSATYFFYQSQTRSTATQTGSGLDGKGDDLAAIRALQAAVKQNKADLRAWHDLGLAFERRGKIGDARKALEKAAKLGDALLETRFLRLGSGDQKTLFQEIHEPLSQATESAQRYIALSPNLSRSKRADWADREEYLRNFADFSDSKNKGQGQSQILSTKEVTTKPQVLSKPEPQYTEEARKHQVTGTVVLRAIFSADGQVIGIFPLKALPDGLTRKAIKAARQIRFVPATKDGKPVSTYLLLEYNFNLY